MTEEKKKERKPRRESQYWLLKEDDAEGTYVMAAPATFVDPTSAWKFATDNKIGGTLHVLCLRGTKTGVIETQEVYTLS